MNNRRLRKRTKIAIQREDEILPIMDDVSDLWTMNKDGKHYLSKDLHNSKWTRK